MSLEQPSGTSAGRLESGSRPGPTVIGSEVTGSQLTEMSALTVICLSPAVSWRGSGRGRWGPSCWAVQGRGVRPAAAAAPTHLGCWPAGPRTPFLPHGRHQGSPGCLVCRRKTARRPASLGASACEHGGSVGPRWEPDGSRSERLRSPGSPWDAPVPQNSLYTRVRLQSVSPQRGHLIC